MSCDQASSSVRQATKVRQRGAVVDLLDVEHLEAGLLHHRIDRLEAEERLGHRRAVAAAVGILEQVELEGPQAELELLGERWDASTRWSA